MSLLMCSATTFLRQRTNQVGVIVNEQDHDTLQEIAMDYNLSLDRVVHDVDAKCMQGFYSLKDETKLDNIICVMSVN